MTHILKNKANGKLIIAGEYEVLSEKGNAIVKAINRGIYFEMHESDHFYYVSRNNKYLFSYKDDILSFYDESNNLLKSTYKVCFQYLKNKNVNIKPFGLDIVSELENSDGQKYGFGSSSAIISGIIRVVINYFLGEISNELLFKLSVLAQIEANELSSGSDLAAAIYGNTVYYERYDQRWVLKRKSNIMKLVDAKWPHLKIKEIDTNMNFAAIWTKTSHKTTKLTKKLNKKTYKRARKIVNTIYVSLIDNKYLDLKEGIKQYQLWLEEVLTGEKLITKEIKKALEILNRYSLAGKISGAGGGDSLIFVYPQGYDFKNLKEELENNNLELFIL